MPHPQSYGPHLALRTHGQTRRVPHGIQAPDPKPLIGVAYAYLEIAQVAEVVLSVSSDDLDFGCHCFPLIIASRWGSPMVTGGAVS